jgi:mannan polymerase II complex MNN10 subunit
MKSQGVNNGYPSFATQNQGFFTRHMRRISSSLPTFNKGPDRYDPKDKPLRSKWESIPLLARARHFFLHMSRKTKTRLIIVGVILFLWLLYWVTRKSCCDLVTVAMLTDIFVAMWRWVRRSEHIGGGEKFVIILGANVGGGVMEWKGAREWAIERDSVRNKRKYAHRWGYDLEIVDMSTKKRYAHEWRESWEKVDSIRNTLRKFPNAEW